MRYQETRFVQPLKVALRQGTGHYQVFAEVLAERVELPRHERDAALGDLFSRIDIYTLWYVLLLYLGVRASVGLSAGKSFAGLLIALLVMLVLGVLPTVVISQLSSLSVMQPFF